MKVGTDAVLLGAIAETSVSPSCILDIGTGCGILALMMAQRFPHATIDAIDIDEGSVSIATKNALQSPWPERVRCHLCSLQDWSGKGDKDYNLIICNPPYFSKSLRNNDCQKRLARHDDALPPDMLFHCSRGLLKSQGEMWIILPSTEINKFTIAAKDSGMNTSRIISICTSTGKKPRLCILSLSLQNVESQSSSTFFLRDSDNRYSAWYRQLTAPFLL